MNRKTVLSVVLSFSVFIFLSCADFQAEQELIGTWVYSNETEINFTTTITTRTMTFKEDNVLTERIVESDPVYGEHGVVEGTGEYRVNGNELYTHTDVTLNTLNNWYGMTARCPFSLSGNCLTITDGVAGDMKYYRQ